MSGVFLSFGRDDSYYVRELIKYLRAADVPVWHRGQIRVGDRPDEVVTAQIDRCAVMIVVMSETSLTCDEVANEIAYAQQHGRTIVPLLLSGEPFVSLARLDWTDVRRRNMPGSAFLRKLTAVPSPPRRARRLAIPRVGLPQQQVAVNVMWALGNGTTALLFWEYDTALWIFVGATLAAVLCGLIPRAVAARWAQLLCALCGLVGTVTLVAALGSRLFVDDAPLRFLAAILAVGGILGTLSATAGLVALAEEEIWP